MKIFKKLFIILTSSLSVLCSKDNGTLSIEDIELPKKKTEQKEAAQLLKRKIFSNNNFNIRWMV
jgi:hypothetical protein